MSPSSATAVWILASLSGLVVGGSNAAPVPQVPESRVPGATPDSVAAQAAPPSPAADAPCRLPPLLPLAPDVRDPVFAVLVGLIESDLCGVITRSRMEREVRRAGRPTRIPVDYLHALRRRILEKGKRAEVGLYSTHEVDLPVPYQILIYTPGRVRATAVLEFEEWDLGTLRIEEGAVGGTGEGPVVLEDVRLWGVKKGRVELDVDGWVDVMLGGRLDDMEATGFAFLRWRGERVGLAIGHNREGRPRSGAFSFRDDRILFPSPPPLKAASAYLRRRLEVLLPLAAARPSIPPGGD